MVTDSVWGEKIQNWLARKDFVGLHFENIIIMSHNVHSWRESRQTDLLCRKHQSKEGWTYRYRYNALSRLWNEQTEGRVGREGGLPLGSTFSNWSSVALVVETSIRPRINSASQSRASVSKSKIHRANWSSKSQSVPTGPLCSLRLISG